MDLCPEPWLYTKHPHNSPGSVFSGWSEFNRFMRELPVVINSRKADESHPFGYAQ
jgi:hypothetical protein